MKEENFSCVHKHEHITNKKSSVKNKYRKEVPISRLAYQSRLSFVRSFIHWLSCKYAGFRHEIANMQVSVMKLVAVASSRKSRDFVMNMSYQVDNF